jgi:methyl-accepting chemotaxis protein
VLARKLRELSNGLTAPLNLLRHELDPLAGLPAGQLAVANSFDGLGASVRKLGHLRTELSALSSGIDEVVGNTGALSGVSQDIHSTGRTTTDMVKTMRTLNQSVTDFAGTANESITQMSRGIEAMNQSLAATSGETKGMAGSLEELNSNMTEFLALFCLLLTSESSCNAKEAARLSPSIIDSER